MSKSAAVDQEWLADTLHEIDKADKALTKAKVKMEAEQQAFRDEQMKLFTAKKELITGLLQVGQLGVRKFRFRKRVWRVDTGSQNDVRVEEDPEIEDVKGMDLGVEDGQGNGESAG